MDVKITAIVTTTVSTPANDDLDAMRQATDLFRNKLHETFPNATNAEFMDIDFPTKEVVQQPETPFLAVVNGG